ncbi:hypothetical protein M430DRAFT_97525, partial [Amorphotheca resinae ATCC 22711]
PPFGVFLVAGCGADVVINLLLLLLGFLPGYLHAFYIEYTYCQRRDMAARGRFFKFRAPCIYSRRVQCGGRRYRTVAQHI